MADKERKSDGMESAPRHGEHVDRVTVDSSLQYSWCFWFVLGNKGLSVTNYDQNLQRLSPMKTPRDFCNYYSHMKRPHELPPFSSYCLFKEDIKPMWEDKANRAGGSWIMFLQPERASIAWELLIVAMVGEQFSLGEEICGATVKVKHDRRFTLTVWNKNGKNRDAIRQIRQTLKTVLELSSTEYSRMLYREHQMSYCKAVANY